MLLPQHNKHLKVCSFLHRVRNVFSLVRSTSQICYPQVNKRSSNKKNKNEMISYIFGIVNQGPNPLTSYPNSTPNHIIISNCYIGCVINNWATPPFWSFLSFKF